MRLTAEIKLKIVKEVINHTKSVSTLAKEYKIARKTIYFWVNQYSKCASRNKKTILQDKYVKGKAHPRYKACLLKDKLIRLIKKNPEVSINSISKALGAGKHVVYNMLKALNLTTQDSRIGFCQIYAFPGILANDIKLSVVKSVINKEKKISSLAKEYNIARKTIYKWLKEYVASGGVKAKYVCGVAHHKSYAVDQIDAILAQVVKTPSLSIHNLAKSVNLSSHGVFNVLKSYSLTHSYERASYAAKQGFSETPEPVFSESAIPTTLSQMSPNMLPAPPPASFSIFKTFILSFLSTSIVASGTVIWWNLVFSQANGAGQFIGLIFATIALVMGSLFFLYSLKYYLSLGIVLSYSNKEDADASSGKLTFKNLIPRILGMETPVEYKKNRAIGLTPSLEDVVLSKKSFVSVQIPFYNEKNVVRRAIEAAVNFKYANYEIILADDSTDETSSIIREYQESCLFKYEKLKETHGDGWIMTEVEAKPGVILKHIHRTTRDGYKGKALELALKLSNPKTEYVSVFDADFVPYPDSLELFLKYFQEADNQVTDNSVPSRVAAVQGYQWHVLNKSENWITRGVRSEYSGSYVIERSGAEIYGGLKQISGSVYMIKKAPLMEVGWGTSITEDFELTLRLYEKGYKVLYTPYIQAPSECVSTLKRLVKQRMRWAEGHSFNVKRMFSRLMFGHWEDVSNTDQVAKNYQLPISNYQLNSNSQIDNLKINGNWKLETGELSQKRIFIPSRLTFAEKVEFLYLSPYYLQALFFIVGTFAWLISETVFQVQIPFWTAVWGWSLVLTNMVSLPLLNAVGLFVEEGESKDYSGLGSFITLSYLLVPFQAYAAMKGFLEKEEGPWFRTPKTGRITDVFARSGLMRFIQDFMPVKAESVNSKYLALESANSTFTSFGIKRSSKRWIGKTFLSVLLAISVTLTSFAPAIESFAPHNAQAFATANNDGIKVDTIPDDFLALNTNKTVYKVGETAKIQMADINYLGETVCNAEVVVSVINPLGVVSKMSTTDRSVKVNKETCENKTILTINPDYEARFQTEVTGTHLIIMEATRFGETYKVFDTFDVSNNQKFEVTRISATRIYPKNVYPMTIKVKANADFKGQVSDILPLNFDVFDKSEETKNQLTRSALGDKQILSWNVDWKAGNEYKLSYYYDTPDKSPDLYDLGKLRIGSEFAETALWNLAIDASGSGTNVVSPTTGTVSATDQTYTFTYDPSETFTYGGEVRIKVPNSSGWSTPQGTGGTAGYTTASVTGTGTIADLVITSDASTEGNWTLTEDDTDACNTAGTNPAADTGVFVEGSASIRCVNTGNTGPDATDSFSFDNSGTVNWSSYTTLGFWMRSTKALTSTNGATFSFDDTAAMSSLLQSYNTGTVSANTWTYFTFTLTATRTAVKAFGLVATGTGFDSSTIYLDEVTIGPGSPSFIANASDTDIRIRFITLDTAATVTVTYGSGGGTSGADLPSSAGSYEFTTRSRVGTSTTYDSLANISTHPTVTLSAAPSTAYSFQRKTWYDGTRYWRSYNDVTNSRINFEYSSDGSAWTENTSARISTNTNDYSIEANSSNVFVVYKSGFDINARSGSSYPGTGFSWSAEQTVLNGSSATDAYTYPVVSRDSSSYVWVLARYNNSTQYFMKSIKETSATNDLPEDSGDSVKSIGDVSNTNSNVYGTVVPLTSQNMYVTFTMGTTIAGCRWVNASTDWQNSSGSSCSDPVGTLNNGLVGYWKLEEAGDAVRADSSGNGYDLTESTGDTIAQVAGKWGNGADFERADTENLSAGDPALFGLTNLTMSAWVNVESISGNYEAILGYNETSDWSYNMAVGDTNEVLVALDDDGFAGGGAEIYSTGNNVSTSTWALFTSTFDGTTIRLYKDGTEVTSGFPNTPSPSLSLNDSSGFFFLGFWSSQTEYFDGIIDDVRLYDRALSSTEVASLNTYDPSSVAAYDTIATGVSGLTTTLSSVADSSGNVHLLYIDSSNHTVYQERTTSWQTAVTLDSNTGNAYPSISIDTTANDLYAFWIRNDDIFYKKGVSTYASGNWDASATSWQTTGTLTWISSVYSHNAPSFAVWTTGSGTPPIDWDIIAVPELLWLFFAVGPLIPLLLKLRKSKYGAEKDI